MNHDLYRQRAKDVMSRDLVTIDAKDTIHDALEVMAENKVAALPVVDKDNRCIGILSTSDLVEVTRDVDAGLSELENAGTLFWGNYVEKLGDHVGHQTVMELMSESVVSIDPETLLSEAASCMLRERIHRLPVVDSNQRLVGILSTTDILSAFVQAAAKPQSD